MRPNTDQADNPRGIIQRLARGENVQAMLRRGEIAGQALALAQHMAAQAATPNTIGAEQHRMGSR